jgi:Ca2+-binding EF-hand superfamily protein
VQRDENWLFQAYIKIHGLVLQKNTTYKRLFTQWRDKNSKSAAGRLNSKELRVGLKKLRAGLSQDEIEKLLTSIPFEGRDSSIAAQDFERIVIQGAKKLESDRE